jgi:arsenate reductase
MAEALLKDTAGDKFEVESAGLEPGILDPLAVDVLKEIGIDISGNKTKSVFDLYKQGRRYDYVITVCDASQSQKCPVFPGTTATTRIPWNFDDPAGFHGSVEEKLEKTRHVRDEIKQAIQRWNRESP